jgi:alkanesulfonate monooxygenase SsuD/methylene tetrahydromethanopterin reductase-like flavin-dependent oxidoreductase (luciferase family)
MRVGVSMRSSYEAGDAREGARWMVERARAAQSADLDWLFLGDHHAESVPYYQNTPMLGRLLAEWRGRGGCLYLLPLWHPVLVAEQVGTLATLVSGPFVLQCGLGSGPAQFAAMGVDIRQRAQLFTRAVHIIRRLLGGEEVSAEWTAPIEKAHIAPLPPEPVEIWVGARAHVAVDRAARLGDAWYAGPELTTEEARDLLSHYRERCLAHRRSPTVFPIRRDVYVGESEADVSRVAEPILTRGYRGMSREVCIMGTVEQVAERFQQIEGLGFTDVITRQMAADQGAALGSLTRLGEVRRMVAG